MTPRQRQENIIRTLRRNGTITVNDLAEKVGASRRTILRDISALREEGCIIHGDPGRGGGLQLDAHSVQTTTRLSVAEVFALIISVTALRSTGEFPFSGLADTGITKIEKALPVDKSRDLKRFLSCLFVGKLAPAVDTSNKGAMDPGLLPAFETSFLQRQHLQFQYKDAKGNRTQRKVEPQAMLILPPLWYLVAWDPSRKDFRHFRLDRISQLVCLEGESFKRRRVPFEDHVRPICDLSR